MMLVQAALQASFLLAGLTLTTAPDFSGVWKLDAAKSDDAESEILKGAGEDTTHGIHHLERGRVFERLISLARSSDRIEIQQTEKDFRISDRGANVRIFYLDGRKHQRQTPWGASLEAQAEWKDGRLTIRSRGEEMGEIEETYGLEGNQFVITVRIRNRLFEDEIAVRHYYDRS
jgi:hypothetical protein